MLLIILFSLNDCKLYEDGGWSDWESWGSCSVTCGVGLRFQRRRCDNPEPSPFGMSCLGNDEREGICNNIPCRGEALLICFLKMSRNSNLNCIILWYEIRCWCQSFFITFFYHITDGSTMK